MRKSPLAMVTAAASFCFCTLVCIGARGQDTVDSSPSSLHIIRIQSAPMKEGEVDIWDPPPLIKVNRNGTIVFMGDMLPLPKFAQRVTPFVLLQPFEMRGFSLVVDPEAPLGAVLKVVDAINALTPAVQEYSLQHYGIPGGPVRPFIWYYPDTHKPVLPLTPPPPAPKLHRRPPKPPTVLS